MNVSIAVANLQCGAETSLSRTSATKVKVQYTYVIVQTVEQKSNIAFGRMKYKSDDCGFVTMQKAVRLEDTHRLFSFLHIFPDKPFDIALDITTFGKPFEYVGIFCFVQLDDKPFEVLLLPFLGVSSLFFSCHFITLPSLAFWCTTIIQEKSFRVNQN